ncbi:hypothetical protein JKY72_02470 [Candidatus Gracilibacteria bacterium]|nr:hypothetical protein [Candidatus Gracilibacteria bacterium]
MSYQGNRQQEQIKECVSQTIREGSVQKNNENIRIDNFLRDVREQIARTCLETLQNCDRKDQVQRLTRRIDAQKPGYVPAPMMELFRNQIIQDLMKLLARI